MRIRQTTARDFANRFVNIGYPLFLAPPQPTSSLCFLSFISSQVLRRYNFSGMKYETENCAWNVALFDNVDDDGNQVAVSKIICINRTFVDVMIMRLSNLVIQIHSPCFDFFKTVLRIPVLRFSKVFSHIISSVTCAHHGINRNLVVIYAETLYLG